MKVSLELTQPEKLLVATGLLLGLSSWFFRIRLFVKDSSDPDLMELLEDTFPTSFIDLLAVHILRRWSKLTQESRRVAFPFLLVYFLASTLLLLAAASSTLRLYFGG
jgi:hypothetical protein